MNLWLKIDFQQKVNVLEMIDNQRELKELFPSETSNLSQEQIDDLMEKINAEK